MVEEINWRNKEAPRQYETVELERLKIAVMTHISKHLVDFAIDPRVDVSEDLVWTSEAIAIRVIQEVFGREVQRQECEWPRDWWQAFKERWYPEWAKRRWPVEYERYVITARELYPQMALPSDRYQGVITIAKSPRW